MLDLKDCKVISYIFSNNETETFKEELTIVGNDSYFEEFTIVLKTNHKDDKAILLNKIYDILYTNPDPDLSLTKDEPFNLKLNLEKNV